MKSTCIICQKEFEYQEIKQDGNFDLSFLRPTVCSTQCETHYRQVKAEEGNKNLFYRILDLMPDTYRGVKLEDFDEMNIIHGGSKKQVTAKDLLSRFFKSDYWNLTLASANYGNGKTRLGLYALAIAAFKGIYRTTEIHEISDSGYYSALSITKILKSENFDSKQIKLKLFCRSRILMIDDLGQEDKRDSGEIAGILKVREENNRKTIITTNLTDDEIRERYTGRISSRIQKGIFQVVGEDYRR